MLRYETLFLTVPDITADESQNIENQLDSLVTQSKGKVISFERWGKYKLAYPVRKQDYGVYFLARFEMDSDRKDALLEDIKNLFAVKHNELVMRNVIVRLDEHASLEYKRPESLEEAPTRDVDQFLKENKMTGLINSTSAADKAQEVEEDVDVDIEAADLE